jgi:hypothetical protein
MKAARRLSLLALAAAPLAGPVAAQPAAPLGRFDDQAIAEAVRATVAEMPRLPDPQGRADFGGGATAGLGAGSTTERAFRAAEVPDCLKADALKHAPPVVYVAGVPIVLGGLLAIPHLVYATSTGKCK